MTSVKEIYDFLIADSNTIFGLILGIIITLVVRLILNKKEVRLAYKLKLFEMYRSICDDIIQTILPLTNMSLYNHKLRECDRYELMRRISDVYYRYYNYLPDDVLLSMTCLYCCLKSDCKTPYIFTRKRRTRRILPCKTEYDAQKLVMKTTLSRHLAHSRRDKLSYRIKQAYKFAVKGITKEEHQCMILMCRGIIKRFYLSYKRKLKMKKYPQSYIANIQARYVIICIDKYFGSNHLLTWESKMKKHALAQR